jgi:hypothetical protein
LLRADPDDNHRFENGTLDQAVVADEDDDIAIEVANAERSTRYVVHCIPSNFPTITVSRSEQVTDGLLFLKPTPIGSGNWAGFRVILDNNGVPRYHARTSARDFRPVDHPVTYRGKQVRYLSTTTLLDANFDRIATIRAIPPATSTDFHDFMVTPDGTFLNIGRQEDPDRDMSGYTDEHGNRYPSSMSISDYVIQETDTSRNEAFYWNAWDHRDALTYNVDCRVANFPDDYATMNSIKVFEGDIVASLRGCSQVLRIDRSGGTGAVVWKLGGTDPGSESDAEYLELVDDPAGEFCGQHDATVLKRGDLTTVVLFDNGVHCLGPRKSVPPFSRAVEYDISSATNAVMIREYRLPENQGYIGTEGGVTVMENGRWLISWGRRRPATASVPSTERTAVTEVDPADNTVHMQLYMRMNGMEAFTYRAYRIPEADVEIPLNLP